MYRSAPISVALTTLVTAWSTVSFAQAPVTAPTAPAESQASASADAEVVVDSASGAASSTNGQVAPDPASVPASAAQSSAAVATPVAGPPQNPVPALPAVPANAATASESASKTPIVEINGYAQLQYESHADSEDQLRQGGSLLNQNRFSVRRIRLELSRRYDFTGYLVELDGNTTSGPSFGLHRAEGSVFYSTKQGQPALIELTGGLLKLPFGYETPESSRSRWFMERTTASKAFFPTEVDVGVRLHGAWRFLRYGVALTNGEPKGTKASNFQLQDPNKAKDVTLRVGADAPVGDSLRLSGGVSYLAGKGFHAGDDATKSRVVWSDSNENGVIDSGELNGVAGTAAVPAENFRRWAVGADFQTRLRTSLGWSTVFVEAVAAVNLDRGLYIANPTKSTPDAREFGWHLGFTQEVTKYAVVGFRYDSYNPDSDLLDSRGGQFLPSNQTISTYSPLIGLALPDRARLVFQYDFIRDNLARDKTGVPTDLSNDQWTLRLQVNL